MMSFVSVSLAWPGDPAPGMSALDERPGTSSKPPYVTPPSYHARRFVPVTLPSSAGEFSQLRCLEDVEDEALSD
jgi:hypothetical protein